MNKHMRLVVSVLFIVIIILAVAITRFYSDTGKSADRGDPQPAVSKKLGRDSEGNRLFQDNSGSYGILDSSDRIIVSPEWQDISFTDGSMCIASKRLRGKNLMGCIDYEGNITIPFIYSRIERFNANGKTVYIARTADSGSAVVYDLKFNPCFQRAWDELTARSDGEFTMTSGSGTYSYALNENGFVFKEAALRGSTMAHEYELRTASRLLLSKLTVPMLEQMNSTVSAYMEYAYTGNDEILGKIKKAPSAEFLAIFPDERSITSKRLMDISDIFIYSIRSEDGLQHYGVSVTADTSLVYRNEDNHTNRLRGEYKAVLEFAGSSSDDFRAVSGKFLKDKPDYPAPEPKEQTGSTEG